MKRISLLVALSVLTPSLCQGYYRGSLYDGVHFSSYAFSYRHSGLVPGGVRYSSYALTYRNPGLVYAGTRFSSHVLTYRNPGLVVDYAYAPAYVPVYPPCKRHPNTGADRTYSVGKAHRTIARAAQERERISQTDGMRIIRQYLTEQGIRDARVDYLLGMENGTGSVAFVLSDRNLVIKYRNLEVVQAAQTQSERNRSAIERYNRRWEAYAKDFEARGGVVYDIAASAKDEIVAALDACDALNGPAETIRAETMYARN
ncbi:MAG: hypothetical protein JW993_06150 [Sedimentisphaerales bacterium]|nr:hypothetical protein [Sedimentisphaerales bacterium]